MSAEFSEKCHICKFSSFSKILDDSEMSISLKNLVTGGMVGMKKQVFDIGLQFPEKKARHLAILERLVRIEYSESVMNKRETPFFSIYQVRLAEERY